MRAQTRGQIVIASTVVALIGVGAAVSGGGDPQWKRALDARSAALNQQYGLGVHVPFAAGSALASAEPAWMRALRLRSEAQNQQHRLGDYAPR